MTEYDYEIASKEGTIIWYFRKGFRPLVRVKIEQHGWELDSFKDPIKKTVDAKAKATLYSRLYARKTNQHCFCGSRLLAAKAGIYGQPIQDPKVKKPKFWSQELKASVFHRSDSAKSSKEAWKEKKKKDKQHWSQKPLKDFTSTTASNSINPSTGKP